jgi:hypothetical protein
VQAEPRGDARHSEDSEVVRRRDARGIDLVHLGPPFAMPISCQPSDVMTLSPGLKAGSPDSITSPTVWPTITSPISTCFAYDFASLMRPRM